MAEKKIGQLIDELAEIREKRTALNKQSDELGATQAGIEVQLIAALEKQGVESSRGASATATISKQVVPRVVDWDKLYAFMLKHKLPYLLEKRPAASVYREVLSTRNGKPIPGVESFEKVSISLRST